MADSTNTPSSGANKPGSKPRKAASAKPAANRSSAAKPARSAAGNGGSSLKAPRSQARSRFTAAIDEARAGVEALKAEALERGTVYRAKAAEGTADWVEEAKVLGGQAKERAASLAKDGKSRASDGLAALGRAVSDNAKVIDDNVGAKYGDYARTAARTMQEAAAKLDSKDFAELGDDARDFVRANPGAAIGIAAVAGYFISKMLRGSDD